MVRGDIYAETGPRGRLRGSKNIPGQGAAHAKVLRGQAAEWERESGHKRAESWSRPATEARMRPSPCSLGRFSSLGVQLHLSRREQRK